MKTTFNARPIGFPSKFIAPVDIIIPFYGQYHLVTELIESIYRFTRSNYFTITVVDDHSPNEAFLKSMHNNARKTSNLRNVTNNFRAIRGTKQRGFAGALKVAYERTENPYICVLHSDCRVERSSWLRTMGEELLRLKKDQVKMVSPLTNNCVDGHPAQGDREMLEYRRFVIDGDGKDDFLSMYCFLCHRDLFTHCGFLQEYPYAGFENREFAVRMRKKGFKQAVVGESYIRHEGHKTTNGLKRDQEIRHIIEEENKFRFERDTGITLEE